MRLGPINDPRIPKKRGKRTGEVPVKLCPDCGAYNHISARVCCDCQKEFIFKTKIKATAGTTEIIRTNEPDIKIVPVTFLAPLLYSKPGKTTKLKLQYWSGLQLFNVWLDFEGIGYPKHLAHDWFRQHSFSDQFPQTAKEALDRFGECRTANFLKVNVGGKYPQVLEYLF